jgi:hypothetical protein
MMYAYISMSGDPPSDQQTLKGSPGGYGSYALRLLSAHNLVASRDLAFLAFLRTMRGPAATPGGRWALAATPLQ